MLIATHRFHGLGSLNFVMKSGKTVRDKNLALRYCINTRRKTYRLAVVVSKKVHKSAVVRNRIRRRMFEHFRQANFAIAEPYDLVITVYSDELLETNTKHITEILQNLLSQTRII